MRPRAEAAQQHEVDEERHVAVGAAEEAPTAVETTVAGSAGHAPCARIQKDISSSAVKPSRTKH
jgi:hypothetical protein